MPHLVSPRLHRLIIVLLPEDLQLYQPMKLAKVLLKLMLGHLSQVDGQDQN